MATGKTQVTVGQYTEVEYIGKGTFGKVSVVYKTGDSTQTPYALKRINLSKCDDKDRKHVEDEVRMLQLCSHENLVAYHDSFKEKKDMCIIMEFCRGGSLRDHIRRKSQLNEKQCIKFLVQICLGLEYLHDRNIAHRDVKTTNIFLTKDKLVKIGDFGLAREMASLSITRIVGTPCYMSPEMIAGQLYDNKTDIWSLGCCVYEMITGEPAFRADTMEQLQKDIVAGQVTIHSTSYCKAFINMLRSMMEQDGQARPTIKKVLQFLESHTHTEPGPTSMVQPVDTPLDRPEDRSRTSTTVRFSQTCPPGSSLMNMMDGDSGISSSEQTDDSSYKVVQIRVRVTEEQEKWIQKCEQLTRELQTKMTASQATAMVKAIETTKNMDNSNIFMEKVRYELGEPLYAQCKPDLLSLWGYKTELLKQPYKIA